jgi:hypothetical protein
MKTIAEFMEQQSVELAAHKRKFEQFEALGPIPGLSPYILHSPFRGYAHTQFKLESLEQFIEWGRANSVPILAIEGTYKTFWPEIPDTRDYRDANAIDSGDVVVTYSTILHTFSISCFTATHKISFSIGGTVPELMPAAHHTQYAPNYYGQRMINRWSKPTSGHKSYLRLAVDKQSADLETLLSWDQFAEYFSGGAER